MLPIQCQDNGRTIPLPPTFHGDGFGDRAPRSVRTEFHRCLAPAGSSLKKGDDILIPDCDADPADIIGYLKDEEIPVLITGPDALLFSEKITELDEAVPFITDPEAPRNISRALISLGLRKYRTSGPDDIGEGPVYIRRSDAEEALERQMKEREENGL